MVKAQITHKELVKEIVAPVTLWLKEREREVDSTLFRTRAPYPTYGKLSGWIIALSIMTAVSSCMYAVPSYKGASDGHSFPIIGWASLFMIAIGVAISWIASSRSEGETSVLRASARIRLDAEMRLNPFYRRAKLIMQACENFFANCDRYQLKYELVSQELEQCDSETADAYFSMIERALSVIERAVGNFVTATQHTKVLNEFVAKHPAIQGKPENTALGQLIELLDRPMEMPIVQVKDPQEILAYERSLQELLKELSSSPEDFDQRLASHIKSGDRSGVAELEDGEDQPAAEPELRSVV